MYIITAYSMLSGMYTPMKKLLFDFIVYCLHSISFLSTKYFGTFLFSTISFLILVMLLSKSCNCENRVKLIFLFSHKSAASKAVSSFSVSFGVLIFSKYSGSSSFSISSVSILSYWRLYVSSIGNFSMIEMLDVKDLFSKSNKSVISSHRFEFDPNSRTLILFIENVCRSIKSIALETRFSNLGDRNILIKQWFVFTRSKFCPVDPKEPSLLSRSSHANSNFGILHFKTKSWHTAVPVGNVIFLSDTFWITTCI